MGTTDRGSVRWHRGAWELRIQVDGQRTTRRHRAPNTRAGRRSAEEALDALIASVDTRTETVTVADLIARYERRRSPGWAPSTRAAHPHHAAPTLAALGDTPVADLRRHHIQDVYDAWREDDGIAASTIARRHTILAAALNMAEADGVILRSPAAHIELPKAGDDQVALDLHDLPAHPAVAAGVGRLEPVDGVEGGHRRLHVAAVVALASGVRRGELVALRWTDVDLDDRMLRVRSAMSVDADGAVVRKLTKGRRARTVRVDPEPVAVLRRWRRRCQEAALALGVAWREEQPVFPSPSDPREVWHPDRVTKSWDRHREQVGLGGMRWHDLRHRHATTLLESGIAVHVVSARLGHASPTMTLNVYAHAVPAGDDAAADAIAAATGGQHHRSADA